MANRQGIIHFANVEKSKRLQRFVNTLIHHPGITTLELIRLSLNCNPPASKAELKAQGFVIDCDRTEDGLYQYTLISIPDQYKSIFPFERMPKPKASGVTEKAERESDAGRNPISSEPAECSCLHEKPMPSKEISLSMKQQAQQGRSELAAPASMNAVQTPLF